MHFGKGDQSQVEVCSLIGGKDIKRSGVVLQRKLDVKNAKVNNLYCDDHLNQSKRFPSA